MVTSYFAASGALCHSLLTVEPLWYWHIPTDEVGFSEGCKAFLELSGKPLPQTMQAWLENVHPHDRTHVRARRDLLRVALAASFQENAYRMNMGQKTVSLTERLVVLERDAQGLPVCVMGQYEKLAQLHDEWYAEYERMTYALEAARDGVWDWDVATDTVYYSPRYISMMGFTAETFPPLITSWSERIHPDERDAVVKVHRDVAETPLHGDTFESTYRFQGSDNAYLWILGRGKVVHRDAHGKAIRVVGLHTNITTMRQTQESLEHSLRFDSLTKLYSRAFFEAHLASLSTETSSITSIVECDVDGLKLVNDHLGHGAGDTLLMTAAAILKSAVRSTDIVARIGGDEFTVLLPHCTFETAQMVLEKIHKVFQEHNARPDVLPVFVSCGVASDDLTSCPATVLIDKADKAMREEKNFMRHSRRQRLRAWIEGTHGKAVNVEDDRL